jgi:hypothetical protein
MNIMSRSIKKKAAKSIAALLSQPIAHGLAAIDLTAERAVFLFESGDVALNQ